jgi:hypothetical protein
MAPLHLNKYNIRVKQQFGFQEYFSTSATYNLLDNIYTALNNKSTVGGGDFLPPK